jgi:RNA polymerase sigma factor (sigma-70 family)
VGIAGTAANIGQLAAHKRTDDRRDTLRRVFERSAPGLYRFIYVRVGRDRHAADDLLQQTCCEAARHRRPPIDHDECEAWLRGVARNLIRRHWRTAKRWSGSSSLVDTALAERLADDLESRPLPVDALIKQESIAQLLLAITSLAAADQELILGFYFDGRSQAAIARDLNTSEKSVESRLYRARGRLRSALRNLERSGGP